MKVPDIALSMYTVPRKSPLESYEKMVERKRKERGGRGGSSKPSEWEL